MTEADFDLLKTFTETALRDPEIQNDLSTATVLFCGLRPDERRNVLDGMTRVYSDRVQDNEKMRQHVERERLRAYGQGDGDNGDGGAS